MRPLVEIYTDGACSHNPGPGGWAAVLIYTDSARQHVKEFSGYAEHTTNQRMELTAAIEGLRRLKTNCRVKLYSDSAYLINAFTLNWFDGWVKRGWKNARNRPVSNQDLWEELLKLAEKHDVQWFKVESHTDNYWNNRCDQLAREAIRQGLAPKQ